MANKTNEADSQQVTVSKAQLDEMLAEFKQVKAELEAVKNAQASPAAIAQQRKAEAEQKMLAEIEAANARADEEVDYYVDLGSLKSNKNLEVNINGVQYIIPKGQRVKLPRKVIEVIENSKTQQEIARGVQDAKVAEAEKAMLAGRI